MLKVLRVEQSVTFRILSASQIVRCTELEVDQIRLAAKIAIYVDSLSLASLSSAFWPSSLWVHCECVIPRSCCISHSALVCDRAKWKSNCRVHQTIWVWGEKPPSSSEITHNHSVTQRYKEVILFSSSVTRFSPLHRLCGCLQQWRQRFLEIAPDRWQENA